MINESTYRCIHYIWLKWSCRILLRSSITLFTIVADTCLLLTILMKHQGLFHKTKLTDFFTQCIYTESEKDYFSTIQILQKLLPSFLPFFPSTSVDPLFQIMFYQPKHLATKDHSQGTKVKGEPGQSPAEVVQGTKMSSVKCSFFSQSSANPWWPKK